MSVSGANAANSSISFSVGSAQSSPAKIAPRYRRSSEVTESTFNSTMFKVAHWGGFLITTLGVFLFLGTYYGGSSMGAMTGTFEAIGKASFKAAQFVGTDALNFTCIILTIGGTGLVIGIMGRIATGCGKKRKQDIDSRSSTASQTPQVYPSPSRVSQFSQQSKTPQQVPIADGTTPYMLRTQIRQPYQPPLTKSPFTPSSSGQGTPALPPSTFQPPLYPQVSSPTSLRPDIGPDVKRPV